MSRGSQLLDIIDDRVRERLRLARDLVRLRRGTVVGVEVTVRTASVTLDGASTPTPGVRWHAGTGRAPAPGDSVIVSRDLGSRHIIIAILDDVPVPAGVPVQASYVETTSPTSITATTEGTADTIGIAEAVAFDDEAALIEVQAPYLELPNTAGAELTIVLTDGGTVLGRVAQYRQGDVADAANAGRDPFHTTHMHTPGAGSHTFDWRAFVSSGTASVGAGAGGAATIAPASIRVHRVP